MASDALALRAGSIPAASLRDDAGSVKGLAMYTRRDYTDAGRYVRETSPEDAASYAEAYGDRTLYGLGRMFAEQMPESFAEIVEELRAER